MLIGYVTCNLTQCTECERLFLNETLIITDIVTATESGWMKLDKYIEAITYFEKVHILLFCNLFYFLFCTLFL